MPTRTAPSPLDARAALPLLRITLFETTKRALQLELWSALIVYDCLDIH